MLQKKTEKSVYKSNALVEASYRLTPVEQRIILACIAQLRRDQPITDETLYRVNAVDYAALSGTSSKSVYKELAEAALRLKRREVWISQQPNGEGYHGEMLVTGWVQSIRYCKSQGYIELRFSRDMLPYLTQLTEQFTRYALSDVAQFNSGYAVRLYELLCQWQSVKKREVSIEWLRNLLQLETKYPAIKDLKRRVIEPAVKQINEHSPLWVKWTQRKTGRQVTHLVFSFGEKTKTNYKTKAKEIVQIAPSSALPKGPSKYGIPPEVIQKYALEGDSWSIAAARARAALKQTTP